MTDLDLVKKNLRRWRADWRLFASEALGQTLDPDQNDILYAIQHKQRVSVRSGTSRGKDFVAAIASVSFVYLEFPSKVINTAPTGRQAHKIMMSEISRIWNGAKIPLGGKLLEQEIKFEDKDHFLIAFKADDKNIEAWSGFHSPNIMVVATEATGIVQEIFDAIEGVLQNNSRLVLCFNPNRNSGEAYRSCRNGLYETFRLNCLNAPNVLAKKIIYPGQVDYDWVVLRLKMWCLKLNSSEADPSKKDFEFEGQWYRPNDLFKIKVLGEFPDVAENELYPVDWVDEAVARWKTGKHTYTEDLRVGVDVAGMGSDQGIICRRSGWYVPEMEIITAKNMRLIHMETAGRVVNLLQEKGCVAFIDAIGEGAGVYSRVEEQKAANTQSMAGDPAMYKGSYTADGLHDLTRQRQFVNLRGYCYWAVRDWLDPRYGSEAMLPDDPELIEELDVAYEIMSNGKIKVELKEELRLKLGRSPDKLDALAMTFAPVDRLIARTQDRIGDISPDDFY